MRTGQLPYTDLPGSALLPGSRASDHAPGRAFAKFLSGPWKIIRWRAETCAGHAVIIPTIQQPGMGSIRASLIAIAWESVAGFHKIAGRFSSPRTHRWSMP